MKEEKLVELSKQLGMNQEAVKLHFKADAKAAEKQIVDAAKFMGLLKDAGKK